MTSPSAKTDTSIGKWKYAAELLSKYISDYGGLHVPDEPAEQDHVQATENETAIVYAPSGQWVKIRQKPSTGCAVWDNVPIGAKVTIVTRGYDWTKINYGRRKGWYMMTRYLKF